MTGDIDQSFRDVPKLSNSEDSIDSLRSEIANLRQICARQQTQLQETQSQLLEVLNTTWWRIGEPARLAGRRFPRLARLVRFAAWTGGKVWHYWRKGVLRERLTDYMRRKNIATASAKQSLSEIFDMPVEEKSDINFADIKILQSPAPVVSVIIPAYGHVDYTMKCLASIAAAPPETPIEVIVVEDASGDPDVPLYEKVSGIYFINRTENLGFLRSCNEAVKSARGEFVFLLNNDTQVMPGAIDELVKTFRLRPDAGLVGSRLVYPDGRQQEAGGIVWKDGSAWNYGRLDDPRRPEYGYVREADYISGAAIMLPRALWNRLGGFDEHYVPAYCEDTDIAFRVRQAGLKVLYQPKSWIIHHEGISHGTDVACGIKTYQVKNNHKFTARWKDLLLKEHYENGTNVMRARDRGMNKKIVLVIDHYVPEPDRDAGSRTMVQFMEVLVASGRIVKFWPANGYEAPVYTEALQQMGVEVLYGPWSGSFDEWIAKNGDEIDEVLLSRPTIAPMFLPALRKHTKAPIVFYGHDLHFRRMEIEAEATKDSSRLNAAQEMKELERRVWLSVDCVLYPSLEETRKVVELEPVVQASPISIYGFAKPSVPRQVPPDSPTVIFVAGYRHAPNVDGASWFYHDVLPHIRKQCPDVSVVFVGSNPTAAIWSLAGNGVTVTGAVTDEELERYYATARVAIIPLRFGAGVKMKMVEALHKAIPVVTTSIGAQGLDRVEDVVDVKDNPVEFADAVVRLLKDDSLWIERSAAQTRYACDRFSVAVMRDGLLGAFEASSGPYETAA